MTPYWSFVGLARKYRLRQLVLAANPQEAPGVTAASEALHVSLAVLQQLPPGRQQSSASVIELAAPLVEIEAENVMVFEFWPGFEPWLGRTRDPLTVPVKLAPIAASVIVACVLDSGSCATG